MDANSVPQDNSSTYANNKKAIYAKDKDGTVKVIGSSGWDAEEIATKQVLDDLEYSAQEAYCEVKKGLRSPLYFYMYATRMDLQILSDVTGFFQWTIKKDFIPEVFAKIKDKRLSIYADVLGKTKEELKVLQESAYECE